jgi:hypothetical protein
MKQSLKSKQKRRAKGELFAELKEGLDALADARQGKRHSELTPSNTGQRPTVTPQKVIRDCA